MLLLDLWSLDEPVEDVTGPPGGVMATVLGPTAHARATRATVPEMATALQEIFGQKLVAIMTGIQDPKSVGAWARGSQKPHPPVERRLREAYHITSLLLSAESPETVRAWFMGMNPHLDDQSPALVLSEADGPARVVGAARAFLADA